MEDLDKAKGSSAVEFANVLIDKVFGKEPENLKKTLL